jgi:hypothetical protein
MADISDLPVPPKTSAKADFSDLPVPPKQKSFGEKAIEFIEPTAEALATVGGGAAGSFLGPVGTVAGAGLGYGMSKEALQLAKEKLGYVPPRTKEQLVSEPIQNVLTGAAYEAGGQALPSVLQAFGKFGSGAAELFTRTPEKRAAKIAGEALGENLPRARQILKNAADDITASQALSLIDPETGRAVLTAPTAQALLKRAEARNPEFYIDLFGKQDAARIKQLEQIAGGSNQTAAKEAREKLKEELNKKLIPVLKTELEAADIAGRKVPKYQKEAARMEGAAKEKVEDVRRFTAAGERAIDRAKADALGRPTPPRYTYMGELAKRAEDVSSQAAEGSLRFGDAARLAKYEEQSLKEHNLRPLESGPVIERIQAKLRDPSLAGNEAIELSLNRVIRDLKKWTDNNGIIGAAAEDAIRKNSVMSAIRELYPAASENSQKMLASKVIESVKPILVDSIVEAGGTGYRTYLRDYALGSQEIAQKRMGGELLRLYQTSPKEFVRFVEGNAPSEVEKIFGPGSYNIFKEMSLNAQQRIGKVAGELSREDIAKEQAKAGTERLADVLGANLDFLRLPHWLSKGTTLTNDVIARLEGKVSKDTLKVLTEAGKSAKSFDQLLSLIPEKNKQEVMKVIKPSKVAGGIFAGEGQAEGQ